MEEMILRWIERVGFPIFVACASMYGMYKLFVRSEGLAERNAKAISELVDRSIIASGNVANAMGKNTLATEELSATIKNKLGSDPENLCKAYMAITEAMGNSGFKCKADDLIKVLQQKKKCDKNLPKDEPKELP